MRRRFSNRRDALIVAVAGIGVLVYVLAALGAGGAGFPLDDSWIHQTYARNFAQTGRWEYVPGIPSAGSTSPFYTVLLAIGYALHIPFFWWTYLLGALALAGAGLIAARMACRLFPSVPRAGLWTGLAIVATWHLVWAATSGMETMLFSTLCLLLIALAWTGIDGSVTDRGEFSRGLGFGLTAAILITTRPEGALLIGLLGLLMVIARPQASWRAFLLWVAGTALAGLVALTPYLVLNYSLNGTILPNTAAAKQAEYAFLLAQPFLVNLWAMVQPLTAGGQIMLVPGGLMTLVMLARSIRTRRADVLYLVLPLWSGGLIVLYALRLPTFYQHGRYVIPAVAPFIVFSVGGLMLLLRLRLSLFPRALVRSLVITTVILFGYFWQHGAAVFGNDVSMINSDMVVAAHWVADHLPPDQLLAVHDIGALEYFAPRPILDIAGLVSPEVVPIILDHPALMKLMQQEGAKYLMVLSNQIPTTPDDKRLCLIFNADGKMGGMMIYKLAWDGVCN